MIVWKTNFKRFKIVLKFFKREHFYKTVIYLHHGNKCIFLFIKYAILLKAYFINPTILNRSFLEGFIVVVNYNSNYYYMCVLYIFL